jgi:uncharacterized membrane protein
MKAKRSFLISSIIIFITMVSCKKDNSITPIPENEAYFPKVKTIIQNNCLICHSSSGTWSGRPISFDSDSLISLQYANIKAAVADPVTVRNKRMPQGGSLSESDIDIIVKWFNKGGKITD